MESEPLHESKRSNWVLSAIIAISCFIIGCVSNLVLIELAGGVRPNLTDPLSFLPVILPLLDALVLAALLPAVFALGWQRTRGFWVIAGSAIFLCWLSGDLIPALFGAGNSVWAVWLRWVGPMLTAFISVFLAFSSRYMVDVWRTVGALLRGGGWAGMLAAIAFSLRIGGLAYSLPYGVHSTLPRSRLQHVPAPQEYATLTNPLENPDYCVVLEQAGSDVEGVTELVRGAVPNRTVTWAAELVRHVPCVIREVADRESAQELAESLRARGASATARDAIDYFVEFVERDTQTPIGRPSEILDDRYLGTGRDAIADLRSEIACNNARGMVVDRETARRAYMAFATAEGRALYQVNCRPCHGTKGSGDGTVADGFSLRPANFRDPEGISMLRPGELLWRIEEGGTALPPEATPWDSSMPAWRHELDRELIWKIILGEFSTSNTKPAEGNVPSHRHRQPITASGARKMPPSSWLDWPVPEKPKREQSADPEFVKAGAYLYYYRCMPCHGVAGRGDGPAAHTMWPRPRDFTTENFDIETPQPKFKFRTTKQGWLPTDEDLYRTISRGLTGTAMEGWNGVLAPQEIWQVIAYLKTLSPAWNDPEHIARNPNDPIVVKEFTEFDRSPPIVHYGAMRPPAVTSGVIDQGRDIFVRFRCSECHGFEARGDGTALGQHYDDWGYRLWPQNLAKAFNYKAGHAMKEIYRTFANRLDGTVMPVYSASTLDSKDPVHGEQMQWALAGYLAAEVESTRSDRSQSTVTARLLSGDLPSGPQDPRWERIPTSVVPLTGQVMVPPRWSAPTVNEVAIRAAVNTTSMALWLRWDDRRPNVVHEDVPVDFLASGESALGPATYAAPALQPKAPVIFNARDQLEIQFPALTAPGKTDPARPPFFYGSEQSPVLLWRWSADRQGLIVEKRVEDIAGAKAERFECLSQSDAAHGEAIDLMNARGPSHLERLPSPHRIQSRATWSNGAWTLVLTGSPVDMQSFTRHGSTLPIAVHIWDGLGGETDLRMAISSWIELIIPSARRPAWQHAAAVLIACIVFGTLISLTRL